MPGPWERYAAPEPAATGAKPWEQYAPAPEPQSGALRAAGYAGRGFNDSVAETVGALPDAVGWAMRGVGIPGAPRPGFYADAAKSGIRAITDAFGTPPEPTGALERGAYGAGRGVADAASIAVPAAAVARGARAGTVLQGVGEALSAQPVMQAVSGAAGGATGQAADSPGAGLAASLAVPLLAAAGGRAISPVRPNLNPEQARLAEVARAEGIPLTAGQETGSRPLRTMESVFSQLPMTARAQEGINDAQRVAFNRAALRRAGVDGDRATPEVMQQARGRIGNVFQEMAARNSLRVDDDLMASLGRLETAAAETATPEVAGPVRARISQVLAATGDDGTVPGEFYRQMDSALGKQARGSMDGNLRHALGEVRDTLRQGMDRSISPEDAGAWQEARRQYAALMTIRDALPPSGAGTAAGNVSPAALAGAVNRGTGGNYAFGRGEMNDLARVGREFVRDTVPDSGTQQRTMMANLLTGGTAGGGLGWAAGGNPLAGAAMGAAGMLAPRAVQAGYNTDLIRRYLTNQLVAPQVTPGLLSGLLAGYPAQEGLLSPTR